MTDRLIIAVDFDGTLFMDAFPKIGAPIIPMIRFVKEKQTAGAFIILWTCRCDEHLAAAVSACEKFGLTFDAINENEPCHAAKYKNNSRKIFAHMYLDDRAYHPADILLASCEE